MRFLFLFFFTILILSSCDTDQNRCFKSAGEEKTEKYDLDIFTKVVIQSDFEVYFENSPEYSVTITCGKNLIPYIDHGISGRELILKDNNGADWLRKRIKPKLIVSCPNLKEINIYETCDLKTIDTLYFDKLSIQNWAGILTTNLTLAGDSLYFRCHATTGDYILEGRCYYAYLYNVGSGYLIANKLLSQVIHIVHLSQGNSEVNASQLLMIENIKYGKVYSFSNECPEIMDGDNDWGDAFINLGCP
ncbi:MAG TPA: DUF2807 domain-containing protein [Bacteroidales bacterium]|nr:DUF2807 domain-containing protein [Bacteroidales bacterium]